MAALASEDRRSRWWGGVMATGGGHNMDSRSKNPLRVAVRAF